MLVENRRDVILGGVGSANPAPLFLGIRHARLHSGSDDGKLQFCEHSRHLNEGLAHGINVTLATVNGKCTNDVQKMYQRRLKDAGISRVLANLLDREAPVQNKAKRSF